MVGNEPESRPWERRRLSENSLQTIIVEVLRISSLMLYPVERLLNSLLLGQLKYASKKVDTFR